VRGGVTNAARHREEVDMRSITEIHESGKRERESRGVWGDTLVAGAFLAWVLFLGWLAYEALGFFGLR